jgi:hypothetical protein
MLIQDATMEKLLARSGVANDEQIAALKEEAIRSKRTLQDVVLQNDVIDDSTLTKAFAEYAQIPYIELDPHDISPDV